MLTDEPWLLNWKLESPLGRGGQGTTSMVIHKSGQPRAVLKTLRYQDSEEARRRMAREVTNLKTLHGAGCKVPQVLDENTEQFENKETPLFFVMEFIQGDRLRDVVEKSGGLPGLGR